MTSFQLSLTHTSEASTSLSTHLTSSCYLFKHRVFRSWFRSKPSSSFSSHFQLVKRLSSIGSHIPKRTRCCRRHNNHRRGRERRREAERKKRTRSDKFYHHRKQSPPLVISSSVTSSSLLLLLLFQTYKIDFRPSLSLSVSS